ncbi:hypothetical protein TESG_01186 [Trichophyton tonsurans CBS 112818]|uniref:Uncharacterized protein n=1 Tax=Trichophyton tonsurans (strain CBS 112818) TaxID=647933 RepID=F2RQP6_TRIT1|nr:hypothetical protein TESG_01186 [Trichophyton tonsurans CBS 112818]
MLFDKATFSLKGAVVLRTKLSFSAVSKIFRVGAVGPKFWCLNQLGSASTGKSLTTTKLSEGTARFTYFGFLYPPFVHASPEQRPRRRMWWHMHGPGENGLWLPAPPGEREQEGLDHGPSVYGNTEREGWSAQKDELSQRTSNPLSNAIIGGLGERTTIHGAMAEQHKRVRKEINRP